MTEDERVPEVRRCPFCGQWHQVYRTREGEEGLDEVEGRKPDADRVGGGREERDIVLDQAAARERELQQRLKAEQWKAKYHQDRAVAKATKRAAPGRRRKPRR